MKRKIVLCLALVVLLALVWFTASSPPKAAAFNHTWELLTATNIAGGEYGLWDDIASGMGKKNEAALFWFINNDAADEELQYKTTDVTVNTNAHPILKASIDLSDYGFAYVGYSTATTGNCEYPAALQWLAVDARKGYVTKSFTLPTNVVIQMVCIWLDDTPDNIATGRSNALIDYIRIESAGGAIGWREEFKGPP
ncbi:MAG: hypothetical protein HY741_10695 [Chloroflexi bacterium]|nr:hypothetical protein [Chloroflexota bacterium]